MSNNSTQITIRANPDLDDCLAGAAAEYLSEYPELAGYDLDPKWGDDDRETVTLTLPSHCRAVDDGNGGVMVRAFASADAARTWDRQI
jgi:hypothetical protein